MLILFAFCGIFAGIKLPTFVAHATSTTASVWDGEYAELSDLTNADYFEENTNVYIRSAKGFSYFASAVNGQGAFRTFAGLTIYLETDIDLAGHEWTPIGKDDEHIFQGIFNGSFNDSTSTNNGHYIYNLKITQQSKYVGLFGNLGSSARIFNTHLRNVQIGDRENAVGGQYVGGLVAYMNSTNSNAFSGNSVEGKIFATDSDAVGGLVGYAACPISSCFANVNIDVTATSSSGELVVGGLVGNMHGSSLRTSFTEGQIKVSVTEPTTPYVGGLVGASFNALTVNDCYNAAQINVSGGSFGGLIGQVRNSATLNHTYNIGDMTVDTSAQAFTLGALIGNIGNNGSATISNSFFVYDESMSACGSNDRLETSYVYAIEKASPQNNLARTRDYYLDRTRWAQVWDLDSISSQWTINASINQSYPFLYRTVSMPRDNNDISIGLSGDGSLEKPYLIETAGDLAAVANYYNGGNNDGTKKYFALKNDISLLGRAWQPIGYANAFNGVFDGNGHAISDLTCSPYEPYTYHGLFGQTENAVIKNLTIENVRFLSEDKNGSVRGNLIGNVLGKTYLINCADYGGNGVNTVGSVNGDNLYVVYGRNNVTVSGSLITDNLRFAQEIKVNQAYEVAIDGRNGTFYRTYTTFEDATNNGNITKTAFDTTVRNPYLAEYKTVWKFVETSGGNQKFEKLEGLSLIDETYGKSLLPCDTDKWGEEDVLLLQGSKLNGFTYSKRGGQVEVVEESDGQRRVVITSSSETAAAVTLIEGLYAEWEANAKQEVRVYYNQYEKNEFNAIADLSAPYRNMFVANGDLNTEIIRVDEDGSVYAEYYLEYNSFVGENQKIFEEKPQYVTSVSSTQSVTSIPLRNGFEVEGVYTSIEDGNKLTNDSNIFVNTTFDTVYAKWKAADGASVVNVVFNTNEDVDLNDAINSVEMIKTFKNNDAEENQTTSTQTSLVENAVGDYVSSKKATFDYTYDLSVSKDEYAQFDISFQKGFTAASGKIVVSSPSDLDTNFGTLTVSQNPQIDGLSMTFNSLGNLNNCEFYNLVGEITITIEVERLNYHDGLNVDKSLSFGVGVLEKMIVTGSSGNYSSNVRILSGSQYVDLISLATEDLAQKLSETQDLYVGFDFVGNQILFSNKSHDKISFTFGTAGETAGGQFYFATETGRKDYSWSKTRETNIDGSNQSGFRISIKQNEKSVFDYTYITKTSEYRSMDYMALANFLFILDSQATGEDAPPITISYDGATDNPKIQALIGEPNNFSKVLVTFEKMRRDEDSAEFKAFSTFTKAYLNVEFVEKDKEGNLVPIQNNAPTYSLNSSEFDINTIGTIAITFTDTNYYEVLKDYALYNDTTENYTLKFENLAYNYSDSEEFRDYSSRFNSSNGDYFFDLLKKSANSFELRYNAGIDENGNFDPATGWQPGLYKLSVVCQKVNYKVSVRNVFVDVDGNKIDYVTESGIQTSVAFLDSTNDAEAKKEAKDKVEATEVGQVLYDTPITASTSLDANNGFVFKGWNLDEAEDFTNNSNIISSARNLSFSLNQGRYGEYVKYVENSEEITRKLAISAVYTVKRAQISGYRYYTILETRESGDSERFESGKLTFSVTGDADYDYNTQNSNQTSLDIHLGGRDYKYYYIAGYRLIGSGGNVLNISEDENKFVRKEDELQNVDVSKWDAFSVDDALQYILKNDVSTSTTRQIYISPILKKKTITLVFHSGTGDSGNLYGDQMNGTVNSNSRTETTANTVTIENPASTIYLNTYLVDLADSQVTIDQYFYSRVGYTKPNQNYWRWTCKKGSLDESVSSGSILYSQLSLIPDMYDFKGTSGEVHFYIDWQPNTYSITFQPNNGRFTDDDSFKRIQVEYDSNARDWEIPVNVTRNGYTFDGWGVDGKKIFDKDGNLVDDDTYFSHGIYKNPNNLVLQAVWAPNQYNIVVNFNSGTDTIGETSKTYSIYYGGTFAGVLNDDGTLINQIISRPGYLFDGFYVINGVDDTILQRITSTTIFDSNLLGFQFGAFTNPAEMPALTLYARWRVDLTYFTLALQNTQHEDLVYTASDQNVYFADFFAEENVTATNITISALKEGFEISLSVEDTSLSLMLNGDLQEGFRDFFVVQEAGDYQIRFEIVLTDQAEIFNLGEVRRFSFTLSVTVDQANILTEESLNNNIYAQNIVKIIEPFVDLEAAGIVKGQDLATVVSKYKAYEGAENFVDVEDMQVYEYIMIKYYLLSTTNLANDYNTYKTWTYANYLEYKQLHESTVSTRLNSLKLFTYFDYFNPTTTINLEEYLSGITIKANGIENTNLTPTKVVLQSLIYNVLPYTLYDVRVYVEEDDNTANYNLRYSDDGWYFVLGSGYVMPQVLTLKNQIQNPSVYYSQYYTNREVNFSLGYETYENNGTTYYNYDGIYISARLYSNGRDVGAYTFADKKNYLFFDSVQIATRDGDTLNISRNFTIVLDKTDLFTILSVEGVASLSVDAKYLTLDSSNNTTFMDVDEDILYILSLSYSLSGDIVTINPIDNPEAFTIGMHETETDERVQLYQIERNNSNQILIYLNEFVTEVVVSTRQMRLTGHEYASLYKWSESQVYNVDGTMESSDTISFSRAQLEEGKEEGELAQKNYFAIFTDLVLVEYNFNFPSTYTENTSDTGNLKLGSSTYDSLTWPYEIGVGQCSSMFLIVNGNEYNISQNRDMLFRSEDGIFVGLKDDNRYQKVVFSCKWSISTQIDYIQLIENEKLPVGAYDALTFNDVVYLYNLNEEMFTYSYVWQKLVGEDYVKVSDTNTLEFENGGSTEDGGKFKLQIVATLREEFYPCLDINSPKEYSVNVDFSIEFIKNIIDSVEFTSQPITYDARDHANEITITVLYRVWDMVDYSEQILRQLSISHADFIPLQIMLNGHEAEAVRNAGTYTINLLIDDKKFECDESITKTFQFEINKREVDLNNSFTSTKAFGTSDPSLEMNYAVRGENALVENITLTLTRGSDPSEDIGDSALYLADVGEAFKGNYIFKSNGVIIFDGEIKPEALSNSVGTFTITKSDTLKIAYIAGEPAVCEEEYVKGGFTVDILVVEENFVLQIKQANEVKHQITLVLNDGGLSEKVLAILKTKFDATIRFIISDTTFETAEDCETYNYSISNGENLSNYYQNVEISLDYKFQIIKKKIDVSKITYTKTFDNDDVANISLTGEAIDPNEYSGLYIQAAYSSVHAGPSVRVELTLKQAGEEEKLTNYELSANYTDWEVKPLSATMTLEIDTQKYESTVASHFTYGIVNVSNLIMNDFVKIKDIKTADEKTVTSWLSEGYYSLEIQHDAETVSEKGYLFKGTYTLTPKYTFQDFVMQVNTITFDVDVLQLPRNLPKNFVVITVLDQVAASYSDTITLSTGEVLNLQYTVKDHAAGETLSSGNYDLQLENDSFLNDSVVVTINENNGALGVVIATEIVYARIVDQGVDTFNTNNFKVVYSKESYQFSMDDNSTLKLSKNGADFKTFTVKYFAKADGENETPIEDLSSLGTITISVSGEMLAVGKYNLSISKQGSSYANVIFAESYAFEITEIVIDVESLNVQKDYDGSRDVTIREFTEKIPGEDVSILARFDNPNIDVGKHVDLYLNGVDKKNYTLSASSVENGIIRQATAIVTLSKLEYTYGQINNISAYEFPFSVTSGGRALSSTQYSVDVEIENAKYTSSLKKYLDVGQYTIKVSGENDYYTIQETSFTITVTALAQSLVFENNGVISVGYGTAAARGDTYTYTMTSTLGETFEVILKRDEGSSIGFYRIHSTDFECQDSNYTLSVNDRSARGAFQITRQSDRVFVLFDDGTTIFEERYNGFEYNKVELTTKGDEYYLTISHTSGLSTPLEKELGFFYYEGGEYKKVDEDFDIIGFQATLQFLSYPLIKQRGDYYIQALSATSSTHDVKLGKDGTRYAFTFTISQIELQLKEEFATKIEKPFNFQDAVYEYADASELFQNLTVEDGVSATVRFFTDDECTNPAIFVGDGYRVAITLDGENKDNYFLPDYLAMPDDEPAEKVERVVTGSITLAKVTFYINNLSFTYGEEFDLNSFIEYDLGFEGFDVKKYTDQHRQWELGLNYKYNGEMSSSGNLPAGQYDLMLTFRATDFVATKYVVDNAESDTFSAKLTIKPKQLQLVETTTSFDEMFVKTYDETADVKGAFTDGAANFNISGGLQLDDVQVLSAAFEDAKVGNPKKVKFTLKGEDKDNYVLEDYDYGAINPIEIDIHFNYEKPIVSNVERNGLPQLKSIGFPFISQNNLVSNSMDEKTKVGSFPTMLYDNPGFDFDYWTIDFKIVDNQTKVDKLKEMIASAGLILDERSNEAEGLYKIHVANNSKTVEFIRLLVNDAENFPEFYFKSNEKITIDFQPNWSATTAQLDVTVTDENGRELSLGLVSVNENADADNYTGEFGYNAAVTVKIKANPHAFYFGFYILTDGQWKDAQEIEGVNITYADGEYDMQLQMKITENTQMQVRFSVQKVAVNISLVGFDNAELSSSTFVDDENDKIYTWNTDYITLQTFAASSLPNIVRTGYQHTGYTCDDVALADEFLSELVKEDNQSTSITLVPTFERQKINVTLNFNHDNVENVTIVVEYGLSYSSSEDWNTYKNPKRDGFKFAGWHKDGVLIDEDKNVVTEAHTLTAQWEVNTYTIKFVVENAELEDASHSFEFDGTNTYQADNVEYAEKITFRVSAEAGYMLSTTWAEDFEVVFADDATNTNANITFTMPNYEGDVYEYTLPIIPISNRVTINGDNIALVEAYNTTISEDIDVTANVFYVPTDNRFTITLTAEKGYEFESDITISVEGVTKSVSLVEKQLVIEIESINSDIEINVTTKRSLNDVTIAFNTISQIKNIIVGGTTYSALQSLQPFQVVTGESFIFFVTFEYGYTFSSVESDEFTHSEMLDDSGLYEDGVYKITLSDINQSGTVTIFSTTAKFTISAEVITWDNNHDRVFVDGNIAYVDGGTEPVSTDYHNTVTFTYTEAANYYFAGWSHDGIEIFSNLKQLAYTVERDETIYAIFSASQYMFSLGTLSRSDVSVGSQMQTIYTELRGLSAGTYTDIDGRQLQDVQIYFGANAVVLFNVPQGFVYAGYGYYGTDDNFVYISQDARNERTVEVNITTQNIGEGVFKIYFVVSAYSVTFDVQTQISINSNRENNDTVGMAQLVGENGEEVKANGYIEGSRTHYQNNGAIDYHNFSIVAYTGDFVYIRVVVQRDGYVFDRIVCSENGVMITQSNNDASIYQISNFVGAIDKRINLYVVFKPIVNLVELSFEDKGNVVEGGIFEVTGASDLDDSMISTSGNGEPRVNVYALTDSRFVVRAYIKLGYYVNDASNLVIVDENGIVEEGATYTRFTEAQILESGFTGMLTFNVSKFLHAQQIRIVLNSSTYTVKLRDGSTVESDGGTLLATIKNVEFGGIIDLTKLSDIQLEEDGLSVVGGKLNIIVRRSGFNFEGYFTQPKGAGVRYFDSDGNLLLTWQESGYSFNQQTKVYERSANAHFNEVTGEVEISLYLYMSYLKTRIRFSIIPDIQTNITAQDIVTGVDVYNSWYYSSQPLYMEVSFGTNIYFNAPEIAGFAFYRFVINQRPAGGDWFAPAYSYSERTPWSTNQLDNFVECEVQIVYFAQVDIRIIGGEANASITQQDSNSQALVLLNKFYVDTSKQFTLTAEAVEGYQFISWTNMSTGYTSGRATITQQIQTHVIFIMVLEGLPVDLDFSEYQARFGQIIQINVTPKNDVKTSYSLGHYNNVGEFVKDVTTFRAHVGDKVEFVLNVERGFAVVWENPANMTLDHFENQRYYFTLMLSGNIAGDDTLQILPTFRDEILSVYITEKFADDQIIDNAIDLNSVLSAGRLTTVNGGMIGVLTVDRDADLVILAQLNQKYKISNIIIENYGLVYSDIDEIYHNGRIEISKEYRDSKVEPIIGTISLTVEYSRIMWEDDVLLDVIFDGEGTIKNPYQISNLSQLARMMQLVNSGAVNESGARYKDACYVLTADLDLADKFWTPIGTAENSFGGQFNFNNHTIKNIQLSRTDYSPIYNDGLFGNLTANARIILSETSLWYVYLIVGIVVGIVLLLVILMVVNHNKKKRREELSKR